MCNKEDFKIWRKMLRLTDPRYRIQLSMAFLRGLERKTKEKGG